MMKLVVLSCVLAATAASVVTPLAYSAQGCTVGKGAYSAPLVYASPLWNPSNYRGPLSLAPGQPADIIAADGRPLDTLDVNLDRSAHFTAKALKSVGLHVLKKRSATLLAPSPFITNFAYSAPLAYAAPLWASSNYRGPLSLAPGQPANILGSDGRPLDTLDVNLDRSAHYTAKALKSVGVHVLKKRSAELLTPLSSVLAPTSSVITHSTQILGHSAPLAYTTAHTIAAPLTYAAAPIVQW